jgi:hypothetical protein
MKMLRWLVLCLPVSASAAELHVEFAALQRLLAEQYFTQEGRRYVRGDPKARCQYAYLENPQIWEDHGRVRVKARFSGRSAFNLFGKCVGLGDSFDLTFAALPYYHNGAIALKDIEVQVFRDTYYARKVRVAMLENLRTGFQYKVDADARRILEQPRPNASYRQELASFRVEGVRVSSSALILTLDFQLVVK